MNKKLLIYVCATEGYTFATTAQVRNVFKAVRAAGDRIGDVRFLIVGHKNGEKLLKIFDEAKDQRITTEVIEFESDLSAERYKNSFQLFIAQMRQVAVDYAASWDAEWVWGLDADVLPKPNSLRCMLDMLKFDDGYYDVAFCPYPSQGGGSFMGGRGTRQNAICPDFYEDECEVPEELPKKRDELQKKLDAEHGENPVKLKDEERKKIISELRECHKKLRECQPKGNVFEANAKGWKKRGWMDFAYPAIGKGAVVPIDWCGSGCTLMSRKAYLLCDWTGYEGEGTEDLYVIWRRWHPEGLRICGIPHCPSDHVIRDCGDGKGKGKLVHIFTGHEVEGECVGHLRQQRRPFYQAVVNERYDPNNDGSGESKLPEKHPDILSD